MADKYNYAGREGALKTLHSEIEALNSYYPNRPSDIVKASADQALNYYFRAGNTGGVHSTFLNRENEISPSHVAYYLKRLIDRSYESGYTHCGIGELLYTFLITRTNNTESER